MGPRTPKARASLVEPALALVELSSIAAGMQAADAVAKRASIDVLQAGTVHNGKYPVLVGGQVADARDHAQVALALLLLAWLLVDGARSQPIR